MSINMMHVCGWDVDSLPQSILTPRMDRQMLCSDHAPTSIIQTLASRVTLLCIILCVYRTPAANLD
jgi:hypothetical protein